MMKQEVNSIETFYSKNACAEECTFPCLPEASGNKVGLQNTTEPFLKAIFFIKHISISSLPFSLSLTCKIKLGLYFNAKVLSRGISLNDIFTQITNSIKCFGSHIFLEKSFVQVVG